MDIKNCMGTVLFSSEKLTIKEALQEAASKKANLSSANLRFADLSFANLSSANLSFANLSFANLSSANLSFADLSFANLSSANLSSAYLSFAYLSSANLSSADLSSADLSFANLSSAKNLSALAIAEMQFIPVEGAFIGWKKCRNSVIVKLLIPEDAKRCHGKERKCLASKAQVIEVIGAEVGISEYQTEVVYRKGETVTPDSFDDNRWNTCSNGIHFYLTREEAEAHSYSTGQLDRPSTNQCHPNGE